MSQLSTLATTPPKLHPKNYHYIEYLCCSPVSAQFSWEFDSFMVFSLIRAKAGRPARTYIQQLCEDTGCCPEDLPRAMNDREEWRERVRDIRATSAIWWWWWCLIQWIQKGWDDLTNVPDVCFMLPVNVLYNISWRKINLPPSPYSPHKVTLLLLHLITLSFCATYDYQPCFWEISEISLKNEFLSNAHIFTQSLHHKQDATLG